MQRSYVIVAGRGRRRVSAMVAPLLVHILLLAMLGAAGDAWCCHVGAASIGNNKITRATYGGHTGRRRGAGGVNVRSRESVVRLTRGQCYITAKQKRADKANDQQGHRCAHDCGGAAVSQDGTVIEIGPLRENIFPALF